MSIRVKLGIYYFLTLGIAVVLLVMGGMVLTAGIFHDFSKEIMEDQNLDQSITTVVDLLVDFQYASLHEPDLFRDDDYMKGVEEKLKGFEVYPFVVENDEIIYSAEGYEELTASKLKTSLDEYEAKRQSRYKELRNKEMVSGSLEIGKSHYEVICFVYNQKDSADTGTVYILLNTDQFQDIGKNYFKRLNILFASVMIILVVSLIYVVSKMIIRPLKELERATVNIREGNLSEPLIPKKNDEIGQVMKAFDKMRIELRKSIETQLQYEENRKEFMTNISHDLKTPITSIKGYVEGIKDSVANTPEKLDKYLQVIEQKTNEMDRMIDDLFLFSKLDLSRVVFDLQEVQVKDYIAEFATQTQIELERQQIEFDYQFLVKNSAVMTIDPQKTTRVLMNILQNAIKYMDKEEKRISLKVDDHEGWIGISIADNGRGIREEDLPNIFERFYRCDPSRNTTISGSGLGLSIAKQIISQQGGTIEAKSVFGEGTEVTIYLKGK